MIEGDLPLKAQALVIEWANQYIDDMGYKLEVLYDYDSQLPDVDCLLEIKEMLEKLTA